MSKGNLHKKLADHYENQHTSMPADIALIVEALDDKTGGNDNSKEITKLQKDNEKLSKTVAELKKEVTALKKASSTPKNAKK